MTVTPIHCLALLKVPKQGSGGADSDPYGGGFFRVYRAGLESAIRYRALTVLGMAALLVAAVVGFRGVPQQFFPDSTRAQFYVDVWAPEGTATPTPSETSSSRRRIPGIVLDVRSRSTGPGRRRWLAASP